MLLKKVFLSLSLLFSGAAYADTSVPEFFYQPEEGQSAVELGQSFADTDADNSEEAIGARATFIHGITHGLALRFGVSYTLQDPDSDGFEDFDLSFIGRHDLSEKWLLHYGLEGAVTPSKTGNQRFSDVHSFNPYLGLSTGSRNRLGAKFTYKSIRTSGDTTGNFNYETGLFGEMQRETYWAGLSVSYDQVSGSEADFLVADLYARIYMGKVWFVPKHMVLPRIKYAHALDDAFASAYSVEVAGRFTF